MRNRHSAVLIVLLMVIVLAAMLASRSATAQTLPTATPFPSPTLIPTPGPTIPPTAVPLTTAGCSSPLPIFIGARIVVSSGMLIRYQPDTSSAIMMYLGSARTFTVTGGPTCSDGYNWWQIRAPEGTAWVAEGRPTEYFIRPLDLTPEGACAPALSFAVGETMQVVTGVRVHETPSLDGLVLHVAPLDTLVQIVGGPTCAEGYNWWRVQVPYSGLLIEGWVVESAQGITILESPLEPTPVCAPTMPRLGVGVTAYVNYSDRTPKNLREFPGLNAPILYTLVDSIGFEVIGGPVCADGMNWWNIQILGRPDVTGWFAEGGPGNYWIRVGGE